LGERQRRKNLLAAAGSGKEEEEEEEGSSLFLSLFGSGGGGGGGNDAAETQPPQLYCPVAGVERESYQDFRIYPNACVHMLLYVPLQDGAKRWGKCPEAEKIAQL
jgi:hypothetical protein